MSNININYKKATIEISKSFEKQARSFGTTAYKELAEARKEFPDYAIVIKATNSKKTFKGMDFDFMKEYIAKHDDAENRLTAFEKLCERKLSYGEILNWFVDLYPVFKECKTRADWILAE